MHYKLVEFIFKLFYYKMSIIFYSKMSIAAVVPLQVLLYNSLSEIILNLKT